MGLHRGFSHHLLVAGVNTALIVVSLVVIELIFGDWFQTFVPPRAAIVDRTFTYRQDLYEPPGQVVYTRDRYGLRGVHEPLSQVDLVTVGGSTTDQRYISEGETWQDVLRALGGVRVANAGVDGMTSFGHVVAVTDWLHAIPTLAPRYYLHLIGVNDAAILRLSDYDRPGKWGWSQMFYRRSALVKAYERLFPRAAPVLVAHKGLRPEPQAEMVQARVDAQPIEQFIAASYEPNLSRLIELHGQRQETVLFVSQAANPALVHWQDGQVLVASNTPADTAHFAIALRMLNTATAEVCRAVAPRCRFLDLAGTVAFAQEDFYDLVHTTPAGAHKIGAFLAQELAGRS